MSANRAAWLRLCFLLLTLAVAAGDAYAQQDEAFARGLTARENGNWPEVERQMQQAISVDARDSERRVRRNQYRPHYFLGEARFRQNNCPGAIDAWLTSQAHAAAFKEDNYRRQIATGLDSCRKLGFLLPEEYQSLFSSTAQALIEADAIRERVLGLQKERRDLWETRRDWANRYNRGTEEYASGYKNREAGASTRRRNEFEEARAAAGRAVDIFSKLEDDIKATVELARSIETEARDVEQSIANAERDDKTLDALGVRLPPAVVAGRQKARALIDDAKRQLAEGKQAANGAAIDRARQVMQQASTLLEGALRETQALARDADAKQMQDEVVKGLELFPLLEGSLARLETLLRQRSAQARSDVVPDVDKLRARITAARRRFDQARKIDDFPMVQESVAAASAAKQELDAILMAFESVSLRDRGVSAALENGTRLFIEGEYQSAIEAFDLVAAQATDTLVFHAHLMRAASLYKLYLRSGEKDKSLLTRAMAAIDDCRRQDSAFMPDPRLFSPRFITLFRTGAPGERAASAAGTSR